MSERQPRRWVAVLLSLLAGGLGHAYVGHLKRGVLIFVAVEAVLVASNLLFASGPISLPLLVAWGFIALLIVIAIPVDAALCAARAQPRSVSRGAVFGVCFAFLVASAGLGLAAEVWRERELGRDVFTPSGAMLPTLMIGDQFFTNPLVYRAGDPERGQIVVFEVARDGSRLLPADAHPHQPRELLVKRIVGVPGDSVLLSGHVLIVNGERRTATSPVGSLDVEGRTNARFREDLGAHHYHVLDDPEREPVAMGPTLVEPGRYYVAGDNRDNSNDSRYIGTISQSDIVGPISRIYWSWDFRGTSVELLNPEVWYRLLTTKARWDRIGVLPE